MKRILPLLLLTILLYQCTSEDMSPSCDDISLDPFIVENYSDDALNLYFHEITQDESHPNYSNPELDSDEIEKILKIIQAVYNSDSPERDTVFDVHKIHGYYCYSFNSVNFKVDAKRSEIENLATNVIPTGDAYIDNLLTTYGFDTVRTSYGYPQTPWITLYTDGEYNMIPIKKAFVKSDAIEGDDTNEFCIGDGDGIGLRRSGDSATITFSIGRGDCPAGCFYHRYWEFSVKDCQAKFVRVY